MARSQWHTPDTDSPLAPEAAPHDTMPTILTHVPVTNGTPNRTALEALTRARQIAQENGWTCAASVLAPEAQASGAAHGAAGRVRRHRRCTP